MIFERFSQLTAAEPDAAALFDSRGGRAVTRAGLLRRAEALAARMAKEGIVPGSLVALQLANSADFLAAVLAIARLDCIAVPIDRDALAAEVGALLNYFRIRGLIYRMSAADLQPAISVRDAAPVALPAGTRLLKLSSGSTGRPKGILTTEENLLADCANICSSMQIGTGDVNLGAIPFSHSYGFSNLVTPLLLRGTPLVISNDYLPQSVVDLCNRFRCTVVPLIPMVYEHLIIASSGQFESVRTFLSAGAPLPASVSRRFRERFGIPIHTFYGCSECGGITYDRRGGAVERSSAGLPLDGVALSVNPSTSRLSVESGAVAAGYLNGADEIQLFEPGRFLADDLVEVLDSGEISITGRVGDLINAAGKKVNPREIEQILLQMPGIRDARVFGESAGARGEVVAAAIVAEPDVTREGIRDFCRSRLSAHKVPRIIKLIDSIPLDERGKFKRSALDLLQ
jgi:long-chain acyl-CoA synthetase